MLEMDIDDADLLTDDGDTGHVTRELDCPLTDTEVRERGEAMARHERDADRLKQRRRNLNAQIRGLVDAMTDLAIAIDARCEQREVMCQWQPDYKRKVFSLVRLDTKAVIEERAMTPDDLQTKLPGVVAAPRPANDNADGDDADADDGEVFQLRDTSDGRVALTPKPKATNTTPARPKAKKAAKASKRGR